MDMPTQFEIITKDLKKRLDKGISDLEKFSNEIDTVSGGDPTYLVSVDTGRIASSRLETLGLMKTIAESIESTALKGLESIEYILDQLPDKIPGTDPDRKRMEKYQKGFRARLNDHRAKLNLARFQSNYARYVSEYRAGLNLISQIEGAVPSQPTLEDVSKLAQLAKQADKVGLELENISEHLKTMMVLLPDWALSKVNVLRDRVRNGASRARHQSDTLIKSGYELFPTEFGACYLRMEERPAAMEQPFASETEPLRNTPASAVREELMRQSSAGQSSASLNQGQRMGA
jgi:hypothetical protein